MGPGRAPRDDGEDDSAPLTALGEFMQRRNAELGLSVAAVAQRVGMSRATWYRIARGESASPAVHLLRGLARVYRVRTAELLALAAGVDMQPPAPKAMPAAPLREAGDALWRCRYERQVRPGALVEVGVDLLNLSDQPWLHAEVRGIHDAWLALGLHDEHPTRACGQGRGLPPCGAALAPTAPGEWAHAQMLLRAPLASGPCVFGLTLRLDPMGQPVGHGALLTLEVG